MTTLVTGATGFVGRHLTARLTEAGCPVRVLVRPGSANVGSGVLRGDVAGLDDEVGLRRALVGIDTVVHLAARVHVMRDAAGDPLAAFRQVNVEGTRALAAAAEEAGVRRFVFASSVKAMGEGGPEAYTEETAPLPLDPYGVSKLEAERVLQERAESGALEVAIVRLPMVYGPGMKGNMLRLFRAVDRGLPLPFGRVSNRRSMLYVENAVDALLALGRVPIGGTETFLCSDREDVSTPDLVRSIGGALGRKVRLVNVPERWFRAGGRVGDRISRLVRVPLTSAAVDRLLGSLFVDASKLERVAGFRPRFGVAEGLARTAEWYREGRR
jgi:nucleoside-diphosphate-sugar epimerase